MKETEMKVMVEDIATLHAGRTILCKSQWQDFIRPRCAGTDLFSAAIRMISNDAWNQYQKVHFPFLVRVNVPQVFSYDEAEQSILEVVENLGIKALCARGHDQLFIYTNTDHELALITLSL